MEVFNDYAGIDKTAFLNYIAKQLSADVTTLVAARDELAIRQGALTAAQDAMKDRELATAGLIAAKAQAKTILDAATAARSDAAAKEAAVVKREEALVTASQQFAADSTAEAKRLAALETKITKAQKVLEAEQEKLRLDRELLVRDRDILDARIKAFQDKVAALTV